MYIQESLTIYHAEINYIGKYFLGLTYLFLK
jgi:hypothetical protein